MISDFWAHFHCASASEMTYIVSSGALNSTHSLTHCACAQTAIWELMGPDLQRIVSATYELLMISGTYDNLIRQRQKFL